MLLFVAASVPLTWVEGTSPNDSYDHFKGFFFKKVIFASVPTHSPAVIRLVHWLRGIYKEEMEKSC